MLFNNLNCDLIQHFTLDDKIKNSIRNCDYKTIYSYLEEIRDDKNLKVEFLYYVAEVVKTNVNVSNIINEFVNKGISTLDVAIDSIMPLLFTGGLNE